MRGSHPAAHHAADLANLLRPKRMRSCIPGWTGICQMRRLAGCFLNLVKLIRHWLNQARPPYYAGADVLLVADCVAYALGGFHPEYLKGKTIAIACPKLDEGPDIYFEKVKAWNDEAKINTLT